MRGLRVQDAAVILVAAILGHAAQVHASSFVEWHWSSGSGGWLPLDRGIIWDALFWWLL